MWRWIGNNPKGTIAELLRNRKTDVLAFAAEASLALFVLPQPL
jgi:hypothetical protein